MFYRDDQILVDPDDPKYILLPGVLSRNVAEEIEELYLHTATVRGKQIQPRRRDSSASSHSINRNTSSANVDEAFVPILVPPSTEATPRIKNPGDSKLQTRKRTVELTQGSRAVRRLQEIKTPFGPGITLPTATSPPGDYAARLEKQSWLQRMANRGIFSNFESTQYMILHHLQNRISRETSETMARLKSVDMDENDSLEEMDFSFDMLDSLLETYFTALRRLRWSMDQDQASWATADQYIQNQVKEFNGSGVESSWFHDKSAFLDINRPGEKADALRMLLVKHLPISLTATDRERMKALQKVWKDGSVKPEQTHLPAGFNGFIDRLVRFTAAMIGATMLLVPVIIMIYVHDKHWRLGITCFAAVVCALFLAFLTDSGPREVFGGTAGYAGLLIVFLGVSS